jgi:hypothetical protein
MCDISRRWLLPRGVLTYHTRPFENSRPFSPSNLRRCFVYRFYHYVPLQSHTVLHQFFNWLDCRQRLALALTKNRGFRHNDFFSEKIAAASYNIARHAFILYYRQTIMSSSGHVFVWIALSTARHLPECRPDGRTDGLLRFTPTERTVLSVMRWSQKPPRLKMMPAVARTSCATCGKSYRPVST